MEKACGHSQSLNVGAWDAIRGVKIELEHEQVGKRTKKSKYYFVQFCFASFGRLRLGKAPSIALLSHQQSKERENTKTRGTEANKSNTPVSVTLLKCPHLTSKLKQLHVESAIRQRKSIQSRWCHLVTVEVR